MVGATELTEQQDRGSVGHSSARCISGEKVYGKALSTQLKTLSHTIIKPRVPSMTLQLPASPYVSVYLLEEMVESFLPLGLVGVQLLLHLLLDLSTKRQNDRAKTKKQLKHRAIISHVHYCSTICVAPNTARYIFILANTSTSWWPRVISLSLGFTSLAGLWHPRCDGGKTK